MKAVKYLYTLVPFVLLIAFVPSDISLTQCPGGACPLPGYDMPGGGYWPPSILPEPKSEQLDAERYKAVVRIQAGNSFGTGFIVYQKKGQQTYILTAGHVVDDRREVQIISIYGRKTGRVLDVHKGNLNPILFGPEVALIVCDWIDAPAINIRTDVRPGQWAFVIGWTRGRQLEGQAGTVAQYTDIIVINTPAKHGQSGGPILDKEGSVIGIVSATDGIKAYGTSMQYAYQWLKVAKGSPWIESPSSIPDEEKNDFIERIAKLEAQIKALQAENARLKEQLERNLCLPLVPVPPARLADLRFYQL